MFFEMNLSCHPPVRRESEHKTDREVKKQPLESILRRMQHEPFSKRQVWRKLSGSCGTVRGIHDTDGHNPHAHILLTVRPLDERGKWQYKTEKEYLCLRNGEERGFTAAEFRTAQNDGWEKQYPYKVDKKKVYMTPSAAEAQGLVRADKHPKSTRYGRQNPISERWNSEEQLATWRAAWADVSNRHLERAGCEERIDHRSNAARGLDEIPTIHEGVTAQALERKGIISDRCEINREIREQNKLIRAIRNEITKLKNTIMTSVPALAKALETARKGILLLRYSWLYHTGAAKTLDARIQEIQPSYERFLEVRRFLREKAKQKKALTAELKTLSPTSFLRRGEIKRELAAVTEDMEELKSELSMLLADFGKTDTEGMKEVKQQLDAMSVSKTGLETIAAKAADSMDAEVEKYRVLQEQAKIVDAAELHAARMELRGEMTAAVREKVKDTFGKSYDYDRFRQADRDVSELLGEPHPDAQRSVLHKLHRAQEQPASGKQYHTHKNEQEL